MIISILFDFCPFVQLGSAKQRRREDRIGKRLLIVVFIKIFKKLFRDFLTTKIRGQPDLIQRKSQITTENMKWFVLSKLDAATTYISI